MKKHILIHSFTTIALMVLSFSLQAQTAVLSMELNATWEFRQAGTNVWLPATVPGTVHTDLLANKKIEDPYYRLNEHDQQWIDKVNWEYRTSFNLPEEIMRKQHITMEFEGLDTYADVFINDHLVLSADNMFRTWSVNVKDFVKQGDNSIRILLKSPVVIGLQRRMR